jgi:enamine deaminase RidA (YjgF/YER057c/UK114 family)
MSGAGVSSLPVRCVSSAAVPLPPQAPWSSALVAGHEVHLSGQTASAPGGAPPGAYEQTLAVLRKIETLLQAAGGGAHNILKLTVYLTDIADKDEAGRARRDFFGPGPYPASTLVAVQALVSPELRVEIDALARLDVDRRQAL